MPASEQKAQAPQRLFFDRRYGWIYDEWVEPKEIAHTGGRGRLSVVPLAAAMVDSLSSLVVAGTGALQNLSSQHIPPKPGGSGGSDLRDPNAASPEAPLRLPEPASLVERARASWANGVSALLSSRPSSANGMAPSPSHRASRGSGGSGEDGSPGAAGPSPSTTCSPSPYWGLKKPYFRDASRDAILSTEPSPNHPKHPKAAPNLIQGTQTYPCDEEGQAEGQGEAAAVDSAAAGSSSGEGKAASGRNGRRKTRPSRFRRRHVVRTKETLFAIAREHKVSIDDIQIANQLENGDIKVGQVLIIP